MLLLQDYWRQIGFHAGDSEKSLMNDLLFNAVQALAFTVPRTEAALGSSSSCLGPERRSRPSTVFANFPSPGLDTGRRRLSLVSLADESVVGTASARPLRGGSQLLSDPGRSAPGPGRPGGLKARRD